MARAFLNEEPPGELPCHASSLDWGRLLRRAEDERLGPLLYAVLRALPSDVPILDRLRTAWVSARRQHLLGLEQLRGVLAAFDGEGVPVIPLKGPTLAESLYRDPGLRPFTDLDLLIRKGDLPRALPLLSTLGYRHLDEGRPLAYELACAAAACFVTEAKPLTDLPIDLHWNLLDYRSGRREAAIDLEEVWDRAVKVERWGQPGLALSPEDLLIYLALHLAVHHALSGLSWQLDLALLLRRHAGALDWEGVVERARRWRVAGAVYFALREVQEQFRVGPPPSLLARLRPRGLRRLVLEGLCRRREEVRERLDYLIPLLLMDRGSDLVWLAVSSVLPAREWVRLRYGKQSLHGAYLAHCGRLVRVCLRTVRAAAGRAS